MLSLTRRASSHTCLHLRHACAQTTLRLMGSQALVQQLLHTARQLAADVGRNMSPHHRGLPPSQEAAAASAAALASPAAAYKLRFANRINAYRCGCDAVLLMCDAHDATARVGAVLRRPPQRTLCDWVPPLTAGSRTHCS